MTQKINNNARALLTGAILSTDTSIAIEATKADSFPIANTGTDAVNTVGKDWFKAVLQDTSGNIEIVYVRTRAGASATLSNVIRAQEGTTALAFAAGSVIGLRITGLDYEGAINLANIATTYGKSLLAAADAAATRVLLGFSTFFSTLVGAADAAAFRALLGFSTFFSTLIAAADAAAFRASIGAISAAVANLFTATQRPHYTNSQTITGTATFSFDPNTHGQICLITCTNAALITLGAPTNIVEGAPYTLMFKAGDTAACTLAFNAAYKHPAAVAPITNLSATVGGYDRLDYIGGAGNTLIYPGADVR